MRDIELNSEVMALKDFPPNTARIMIMYDARGWAVRCYDEKGSKITTMEPWTGYSPDSLNTNKGITTLVPKAQNDNWN